MANLPSQFESESQVNSIKIKPIKPLSTTAKCAIVAFAVVGLFGIVIIALSASTLFGKIGSLSFTLSTCMGGGATLSSAALIIYTRVTQTRKSLLIQSPQPQLIYLKPNRNSISPPAPPMFSPEQAEESLKTYQDFDREATEIYTKATEEEKKRVDEWLKKQISFDAGFADNLSIDDRKKFLIAWMIVGIKIMDALSNHVSKISQKFEAIFKEYGNDLSNKSYKNNLLNFLMVGQLTKISKRPDKIEKAKLDVIQTYFWRIELDQDLLNSIEQFLVFYKSGLGE